MAPRPSLPLVSEPDANLVHVTGFPSADAVTLCGLTDFLGHKRPGKVGVRGPVTCRTCREIVAFIHDHRPLRKL